MDNDFVERLREAIKNRGITASELSRLSGVGKSDISYYLKGRYLPKQDKVYMLAKALGVNPGWLMTGVDQVEEAEVKIPVIVPDNQRFVELMKYMTPDDYEMVMQAFERANKRYEEEMRKNQHD